MGITGLLPFLQQATTPCHISSYRGATMVVDTYCWLHKGATACAFQLTNGGDTRALVSYCTKYIKLLQAFNIKPILVFDGKNLPAKAETESKRREARNVAKKRADELMKLGKTDEAQNYLRQSVNITPEMATAVIKECRKLGVDCIVAPYEADAQMAFFTLRGVAEFVITEDSDLMLFGCPKVIYKLDTRGCGFLVDAEKIPLCMSIRPDNYTFDKFRNMCILSGCDYVNSLPGIGLKKAAKFIKLTQETNPIIFLDKLPRYLNMKHLKVTDEYKERFMLAVGTFKHQIIFDPFERKLMPLTDPAAHGTKIDYCKNAGKIIDNEVAYQLALGNLHPSNNTVLDSWSPTKSKLPSNSIWSGSCHKSKPRLTQQLLFRKKESPKKRPIVNALDDEDYDLSMKEADLKIEQEIAAYFKKPEKRKIDDNVEQELEEKKQRTSPVIVQNPFLKKLSKFQRTKSDDVIVKSRYFSATPETNKRVLEDESSDEVIRNESESENSEDCVGSQEMGTLSDIENVQQNSLDCPINAMSKIKLDDSSQTVAEKIDLTTAELRQQPCSSKSLEPNQRKRTLGPARRVSFKKMKTESQLTMHNFFQKKG